jgi:hypothetical protein
MTPEDEEFNRVEMESRIKQDYVRDIKLPTREQLMAEVTVLTELVRVLSDRAAELEAERNFCQRCGKYLFDGSIHTCTPPLEKNNG